MILIDYWSASYFLTLHILERLNFYPSVCFNEFIGLSLFLMQRSCFLSDFSPIYQKATNSVPEGALQEIEDISWLNSMSLHFLICYLHEFEAALSFVWISSLLRKKIFHGEYHSACLQFPTFSWWFKNGPKWKLYFHYFIKLLDANLRTYISVLSRSQRL